MKLTVQIKLSPNASQKEALLEYLRAFNAAANHAAQVGFTSHVYSQPSIHAACYRELRDRFGISSQTAVRAIGKAVECFARSHDVCPAFRSLGAATYDQRTFGLKGGALVSLLTLTGRILVPYAVGDHHRNILQTLKGQADLVYRNGQFFLHCTAEVAEPCTEKVNAFLGVDLGICQLATDATGESFSGEEVEKHRRRHARTRRSFCRKNTKSARRHLKRVAGKQRRYQQHTNHTISKRLVAKAKALGTGIAIEDLKGIRARCEQTVSRRQRKRLSNWSFAHLRHCLTYKARLAGVPLVTVNPRNTSRTCFLCGHCSKDNRKSQHQFLCVSCGHKTHADQNAAQIIGRLGEQVNLPHKQSTQPNCKAVTN